jgi:hypothetical protein
MRTPLPSSNYSLSSAWDTDSRCFGVRDFRLELALVFRSHNPVLSVKRGTSLLRYRTRIRKAGSVRRPITGGNAALRYRFPLPNGTYRGLRFDPSDLGSASITIRNALIVDRNGRVLRQFRPVQFRPAQRISRFHVQKGVAGP